MKASGQEIQDIVSNVSFRKHTGTDQSPKGKKSRRSLVIHNRAYEAIADKSGLVKVNGCDAKFSSLRARSRKVYQAEKHHSTRKFAERSTSKYGEKLDKSPSLSGGRKHDMRKESANYQQLIGPATRVHRPLIQGIKAHTPTCPAQPWGYSNRFQFPKCSRKRRLAQVWVHSLIIRTVYRVQRQLEKTIFPQIEHRTAFLNHPSLQGVVTDDQCSEVEEFLRSKAIPV